MHPYRTHTCGALRAADAGQTVRLSGWVHRKRDHGGLLFVDLRDHYGMTQCVLDIERRRFEALEPPARRKRRHRHRQGGARRPRPSTPSCRPARSRSASPRSPCSRPPRCCRCRWQRRAGIPRGDPPALPLPRPAPREAAPNIVLRAQVIASIRRRMIEQGFTEFQTPILTASSPEGARDFLVPSAQPSRQVLRPAAGAAAVQAAADGRGLRPLLPDRALLPRRGRRADRSPGEFYQLDFEMSFVTQEDVFAPSSRCWPACSRSSPTAAGHAAPFPRIPTTRRC
jgi:aspartyl-tRNA synthetase